MRVRLWIQQRHELPCASRKLQGIGCAMIGGEVGGGGETLGGGDVGEFKWPLGESDDVKVGDLDFWSLGDFRNRGFSRGHRGVWCLMMNEEDGELVICIWREFIGRDLVENGMNLDKFREFQMLFKHSGQK
ncbi:hypothetical protein Tco_1493422 [Tanacetum coccineum]